jgi:hypothetical protein
MSLAEMETPARLSIASAQNGHDEPSFRRGNKDFEPISHPDQLGQGSGSHLLHHPMAVNFNRGLAGPQFRTYVCRNT